ncbi:MAG: 30S ribosome-binding factor RbfA [Anaerolineales bacterium]|jgi:ribosome-binding factor A
MVSKSRAQRISDRMHEELSEMLIFNIQDPRISGAYITDVSVDRELAYADIYVFSPQGSGVAEEVLSGFNHASGFLRSELAGRIELRTFPQLRFHWDPTPERAEHIEELLDSLSQERYTDSGETLLGNE